MGEARGNRGRGGRVGWWRKKRRWRRRKEESRVNRGQVALPDATRSPTHPPTLHPSHPDDPANPPSSSASSSSSSSSFSTSYPNLCPLLLPLPPSYPRGVAVVTHPANLSRTHAAVRPHPPSPPRFRTLLATYRPLSPLPHLLLLFGGGQRRFISSRSLE